MTARAGNALILVGVIALVVFLVMFSAGELDVLLLVGGAAISALGLLLRRRAARREQVRAGRFRTLRRVFGRKAPAEDDEAAEDSG
jgi:membrane protein implicated in regulation of membrane protease activity